MSHCQEASTAALIIINFSAASNSPLRLVKNGYRSERQHGLSRVKDDLSLVASRVNTSGRLSDCHARSDQKTRQMPPDGAADANLKKS